MRRVMMLALVLGLATAGCDVGDVGPQSDGSADVDPNECFSHPDNGPWVVQEPEPCVGSTGCAVCRIQMTDDAGVHSATASACTHAGYNCVLKCGDCPAN